MEKVAKEITRSDLVIVVLTKQALRSPWIHQEIGLALGKSRTILPVFQHDGVRKAELPAMLGRVEWEPYYSKAISTSALRTAARAKEIFGEHLKMTFRNYLEYYKWWYTIDEKDYTSGICHWATPHDLWSWVMAFSDQINWDVIYKTLIRGSLAFDQHTVASYMASQPAKIQVKMSMEASEAERYRIELDRVFTDTLLKMHSI